MVSGQSDCYRRHSSAVQGLCAGAQSIHRGHRSWPCMPEQAACLKTGPTHAAGAHHSFWVTEKEASGLFDLSAVLLRSSCSATLVRCAPSSASTSCSPPR